MARQLHLVGSYLTGNRYQWGTVQERICHAGYQVGGSRSQCGQADTCFTGQPAVYIRHKCRTLFMPRIYKMNAAFFYGKHQIQCFFSGNTEYGVNAFFLQAFHQHFRRAFFLLFFHMKNLPFSIEKSAMYFYIAPLLKFDLIIYTFFSIVKLYFHIYFTGDAVRRCHYTG